jgi:hypothetical protein
MSTILLASAIVLISILGMAIGTLLGGRGIQGSCGGAPGGCTLCSRRCRRRDPDR